MIKIEKPGGALRPLIQSILLIVFENILEMV